MNKLKRKLLYNEIIEKSKSFNIKIPYRIHTNINNNILNYLTHSDEDFIKNKILMLDKETQKDYEINQVDQPSLSKEDKYSLNKRTGAKYK